MKLKATLILISFFISVLSFNIKAQEVGDYRTQGSGDWSSAAIWQGYNGSTWQAVGMAPDGSQTITVLEGDSVYVGSAVSISDTLINQGIVHPMDSLTLTIADGGVYQHDRDEGKIPKCIWAEGSTAYITGITGTAPDDRDQDYFNLVFNTPDLASNLNMNLNSNTIGGDIRVINTNFARWYLTTALAFDTSIVTIMGDVIVEDGTFGTQGTSNGYTTFIVHHYGNIIVTGGNFSISRGSQGFGTTTWYLYEGDFSMSNATTQSSTVTPDGAKFIFTKEGVQTLALGEGNDLRTLPIEVSAGTTLDMGMSWLDGSGNFHLKAGASLFTALPGGIDSILVNITGTDTLETGSGFGFNGSSAQITSERIPDSIFALTIDNEAGVTLSKEIYIDGILYLVSGLFDNTIPFTFGPNGDIVNTGGSLAVHVDDPISSLKSDPKVPGFFFVNQNYPNPFNPTTTIKFGIPKADYVTARLYNTLGKEVLTLYKGHLAAGSHQLTFSASSLSSGTYFYLIQSGNNREMKKMILIK